MDEFKKKILSRSPWGAASGSKVTARPTEIVRPLGSRYTEKNFNR